MNRLTLTEHNHEEAAAVATEYLAEGGVVMVPTDTAYALAADATNEEAVEAVFRMKGRPQTKSASVVVSDRAMAESLARFSAPAIRLWDAFLPGPLTLVLPVADAALAPSVTHEGKTLGLRYPKLEVATMIAERLGHPYTATSANLAGHPPAYDPDEFLESLPDKTNPPHLLIDGGTLPMVPVSTVVEVEATVKVLRESAIPEADIQSAVG